MREKKASKYYFGFSMDNLSLCIGSLPGRKTMSLYLEDRKMARITPLAYFVDDISGERAIEFMETFIKAIERKTLRLQGYQPTQDPGKIRPPKGGTGTSKPR